MLQDQYSDVLTHIDSRLLPGPVARQPRVARVLRHVAAVVSGCRGCSLNRWLCWPT